MRVSITDRCNLRCLYCASGKFSMLGHDEIMRYEEIERIVAITSGLGIDTIRVTGGEPMARRGAMGFIEKLVKIPGIKKVSLTTNGTLLDEAQIKHLADIGLYSINISIDSLDAQINSRITGSDSFGGSYRALIWAVESGLRTKANCVLIKGLNEAQLLPMSQLAINYTVDVRFIELMPAEGAGGFEGVCASEILKQLEGAFPGLAPDSETRGSGPAEYYKSPGMKGSLGIISAKWSHSCQTCNRVRLTSEGFMQLCLFQTVGIDLRKLVRKGTSDEEISEAIAQAIFSKPRGIAPGGEVGMMSRIGG
ncbi:MAG: radical SAM protein [Eubacteriaceae bacterium]|nr:radical SAM protein [Eubacteriaceae bacterium]